MAVGKSTLGLGLARHLGLPFVDLDKEVERMAGQPVSEIFASAGEAAFRAREASALASAVRAPQFVLALGGGTLHQPHALQTLHDVEIFVLQRPWPVLAARLAADSTRPLAEKAAALYAERHARESSLGRSVWLTGDDAATDLATLIAAVEAAA
jgi:shikimate kinase